MKVTALALPELLLIDLKVFGDARGWFAETWQAERYVAAGIPNRFVQDNAAYSQRGVLRGLHCQHPYGQGKLIQVLRGEIYDVAVDVRHGSPTFGQWVGIELSSDRPQQAWIPPGFAHGYCVLSPEALFTYKCTDYYHPETQFSVRWDDPAIGIDWPLDIEPILAEKDRDAPVLREIPPERLPPHATLADLG
jgi:dTDP-4-dehydrorhamnose 3,5-epimerase